MKILGQDPIVRYLENAFAGATLFPSLLLVGPDGVGKRRTAFEIAKGLLCGRAHAFRDDEDEKNEPCAECRRVQAEQNADFLHVSFSFQARLLNEKEESQRAMKIETMRFADNFLRLKSLSKGGRVVAISEADTLTDEAANALLKVLEEPPANAHILLLAKDDHSLFSTLVSRCVVLRFRPLPAGVLTRWLHYNHGIDVSAAEEAAERSHGSFSKALLLATEETTTFPLASLSRHEFFRELDSPVFRRDARKKTADALTQLLFEAERALETGSLEKEPWIEALLAARRQLDRNVTPRLLLENLYLIHERVNMKRGPQ